MPCSAASGLVADLQSTQRFAGSIDASQHERVARSIIMRWTARTSAMDQAMASKLMEELAGGPWSAEIRNMLSEALVAAVERPLDPANRDQGLDIE